MQSKFKWHDIQYREICLFYFSRSIPNWLIWIKYLSWLYYANEMALVNQWEDVTSLGCTTNSTSSSNSTGCFQTGNDVINYYGFSKVCRKKYIIRVFKLYYINIFLESL